MEPAGDSSPLLELETVVLFVDVVESVRLLQRDEVRAVHLLRDLMSVLVHQAVTPFGGQVVERQGDGLLLRFDSATTAVSCGLAMHEIARSMRPDVDLGEPLQLRVGVHADRLLTDATILYGNGVNLAARVLQVAGPGETVVTSTVRDTLTDDVDFRIDDLGFCYLKHWNEPIRLWRVSPLPSVQSPSRDLERRGTEEPDARLSIAVLGFDGSASLTHGLGDFLNGAFVAALTKQPGLRVTSPLSANRLRGGLACAETSARHLGVRYVLTGSMQQLGGRLIVNPQLVDSRRNEVIWADQVMAPLDDWLQPHAAPVQQILADCIRALGEAHIRHAALTLAWAPSGWDNSLFNLTVRRVSREVDTSSLGGTPVFRSSSLAAVRYTYGFGDEQDTFLIAELSNARTRKPTEANAAFKSALGIDHRIGEGVWLEMRAGRSQSQTSGKEETKVLFNLKLSPEAGLPKRGGR